ncbi:MAG TPA: hypothetical protein PLY87_15690 [Planctomycetaceae bacterium]|nr:hypothetical protein [Planctomycetaceae bacterium]
MANYFGVDERPDESASANPDTSGINLDGTIYGIPWPANRLTYGQMRTLRQISKDVRTPITQLLKDAVDLYLIVLQRELQTEMMLGQDLQLDGTRTSDDDQTELVSPAPSDDDAAERPDEDSPTGRTPKSGCHEKTRMIAEATNGTEPDLDPEVVEPSGPKTQRSFMFSGE